MAKCVICGKECAGECCGGACRAKKSRRTQERTEHVRTVEAHAAHGVTIDANGNEHPIDYEGRLKDWKLLESWAGGTGTPQQQRLGVLAAQYDVINGYRDKKTNKITAQGRRYLGLEEKAA